MKKTKPFIWVTFFFTFFLTQVTLEAQEPVILDSKMKPGISNDMRIEELKVRWKSASKLSQKLATAETNHGLVVHRGPEAGFMGAALDWASGTPLVDVLEEDELTAGDFVRTIKQLIDLLRQLSIVLFDEEDRNAASKAAEMCFRGVVAASSSVGRIAS